jgi:hypothetical protein
MGTAFPPIPPLCLVQWWISSVLAESHFGRAQRVRGEEPGKQSGLVKKHFLWKSQERYDMGTVAFLLRWIHPLKQGAYTADRRPKNPSRCTLEMLGGDHDIRYDFPCPELEHRDSCLFFRRADISCIYYLRSVTKTSIEEEIFPAFLTDCFNLPKFLWSDLLTKRIPGTSPFLL